MREGGRVYRKLGRKQLFCVAEAVFESIESRAGVCLLLRGGNWEDQYVEG